MLTKKVFFSLITLLTINSSLAAKEILIGVVNGSKLMQHANALKKVLEFDKHADVIIETFTKSYSKNDIIAFFVKGHEGWILKENEWVCVSSEDVPNETVSDEEDEEFGVPSRRVIILSCNEKDIEWQVYDRCYCWHDGPEVTLLKTGIINKNDLSASAFALQIIKEIWQYISDPIFDPETMTHKIKELILPSTLINDEALDTTSINQ